MSALALDVRATMDDHLREQCAELFRSLPFGGNTVDWCEMLGRAEVPRLEIVFLPVHRDGELRALGILHIVRRLDLAEYIGNGARRASAIIAKANLRPLSMDIGFLEVPLCNRPGILIAPDAAQEEREEIQRAIIQAAREHARADLFAIKGEPAQCAPAAVGRMARVPFMPNAELPLPFRSYAEFLATLSRNRRSNVRKSEARFNAQGGDIVVLDDFHDRAAELAALYASTCAAHRARGALPVPIPIAEPFFRALSSLKADSRRIVIARVKGRPAAFSLIVKSGDQLVMKTCGVDYELARASNAYFALSYSTIKLAIEWGMRSLDLGPTTFDFKESLGARLHPTEYHLQFDRWYMRPLGPALKWHFGRQDRAA